MNTFTIDELSTPATLDDEGAGDFIEMTDVRNEIEADIVGNYDLAYSPAELLPNWQDPYQHQRAIVARVGGRIVARALYRAPIEDDSNEAWFVVEVLSDLRRRGIGAALYDRLAGFAAEQGRTVLQSYVLHKGAAGERIAAPTGYGSVPRDSPEIRFALARGFALEQVGRMSRLELPADALDQRLAAATTAAGPDYRVVLWTGRTPQPWLADSAMMHARMSTDAPSAGLDVAEEVWDEARVIETEDRDESSPRTVLLAAAQHVPTGRLVAFSELSVPPLVERPVSQQDTLVIAEHRGHRLGLLVKLANLQRLADTHPGHPAVTTFNAEENRRMLDVNEAIGFRAVGYEGGWKKTVQPPRLRRRR